MNQAQFYEFSGYGTLIDTVSASIKNTMQEAVRSGSHPMGSWIREGDKHHITRAADHLIRKVYDADFERVPSEDLEHALCRLAMALHCRQHGVIGNFGSDGEGR